MEDDIIRGKWLMDGSSTLEEAAENLEREAKRLRELAKSGHKLRGPVEDDYGFVVRPKKAARRTKTAT